MESIELNVRNHMKRTETVQYPDFDQMLSSIEKNELRIVDETYHRPQRRKTSVAIIAGVSVAVLATPVYAAVQYDWSSILSKKPGIEAALKAGYGQQVEQSATDHGVTLTVHTAFTDENRTFLLYTLKPEEATRGQEIRYDRIVLKDSSGAPIEGHYVQKWNAEQGVYQGYFETNWVMKEDLSKLQFSVTNVRYLEDLEQEIHWNPNDPGTQQFTIQKDGIQTVKIQALASSPGQILLNSFVTFTDAAVQEQTWARIAAYDSLGNKIRETESPAYGTSGATGEYTSQQKFSEQLLKKKGNRFALVYTHEKGRTDGSWNVNLSLSRKQMESGSFRKSMDIPLHTLSEEASIRELVVTPTQIRLVLNHQDRRFRMPYQTLQLDVGGRVFEGEVGLEEGDSHAGKTVLRFEPTDSITVDIAALENTPITLIGKERVDVHKGSDVPVRLTDISSQPQTIRTSYEGYPVHWTYYIKDNNLYVESESPDASFGGINQTYFVEGKESMYLIPQFYFGSGNKHTDMYKNFNGTDLDLYVWNYTTKNPDDELRVKLN
ncbi:DUF4179 domain-containing protein [Paenibacillus sp. FSL W8-0194]|uniref:DUF4179 domain-containing protein n=1 Tax=Paenibacillus sp. FSL W8-0194 TaxID=2921711 RepID=UPI0030D9FDBA